MSIRFFRWRTLLIVLLLSGAAVAVALYYHAETLVERQLRPATIELLERHFDSDVELASLRVSLGTTLSVQGEGLTIRKRNRGDLPPLITMKTFTIESGLRELRSGRVDRVYIDGLEIVIPPRRGADMPKPNPKDPTLREGPPPVKASDIRIGEILAENSSLTIMPKRADKNPRVFAINRLKFDSFSFDDSIPFEAAISNPTPRGEIAAVGSFGPWDKDEPSLTPVNGTFLFDADLATIKGIGGTLHAEGDFSGPLELIRSTGKTRTKGFYLSSGGTTFPLTADYVAIVDGTNGDTRLERVDAVLNTSRITAKGEIAQVGKGKGRRIRLNTTVRQGRLDDLVKLATRVKSSPLTGMIDLTATLDIPPGPDEVIERMDLGGTFTVARAQFSSETIQDRVDELSRRGVGRPNDQTLDDVASNFRGRFRLNDAKLALSTLTFSVEGATVNLAGDYDIAREELDFKGELRLQARASQTQTGWKRFVLKVFDPLLDAEGAGTVLPISITGSKNQPKFGADLKKALFK